MKKFSALPKKSMAVISLILTLALMLGSVVAVPASAATTDTPTWAPLKNISDANSTVTDDEGNTTAVAPTATNPEFTWGFRNYAAIYKDFDSSWTAPTIGFVDGGLSAKWSAYEGAASYVLNFYNDSLVPTASVATIELTAATTELSFGETYNVQVDALDSTGKVIASSVPRKYDYIAYTFFNATDYVPATEEKEASHNITYNDRIDGNVNPNPAEVIDLEAAPNGKALVTGDMQNFYYSNHKVNGIELSELDAVAVWIGQSGFTVGDTTYYPDYSTYSITLDGYAEDNDSRVGSYAGTKSSSVKICTECGIQNASDATACTACEGTLTSCATQYFIPTDGNEVGYAADAYKIRHNNNFNNPHIAYTVGGYYVFSLDKLTAEEKTVLLDSLSNGYKFGCSFNRGSLAYRYKADGTWTKLTTTTAAEIEGFDTATADNKIYISNMMIISDMDKFLTNNGITPVTVTKSTQYKLTDEVYAPAEISAVDSAQYSIATATADTIAYANYVGTYTSSAYDGVSYTYRTANGTNTTRSAYINANIDSNLGMDFGFTAVEAGRYYVSNVLNVTSATADVNYRISIESNGKRTAYTDTLVISSGALNSFDNLEVELGEGDTLWLEAWSSAEATLRINNPMFTKIAVTEDNVLGTETRMYKLEDMNFFANHGNVALQTGLYIDSINPWKLGYYEVAFDTTTETDEEGTETTVTTPSVNQADPTLFNMIMYENSYAVLATAGKSNRAIFRHGLTNNNLTSTIRYYKNFANTIEFTMPKDGDLTLSNLSYLTSAGHKYRFVIEYADGTVSVGDWTTPSTKILPERTFSDLKKGDVVRFEAYTSGSANARGSAPVATVTSLVDVVLGDANKDEVVNLLDLVHLKKAEAGIIERISNADRAIDLEGDGIDSTELTVMRRALIKVESHEEYLARITAEAGTSTPEVA